MPARCIGFRVDRVMISMLHSLQAKLHAFRAARSGNVTLTFALALLPIVGFVGAAVDYSHANAVRTAIQAAVDSTALMLSKEAATLTSAQINTKAFNYFMTMFNRPDAKNIVVTPTYSTNGGSQMIIKATADVPTNFMGIMGFNTMAVSASSTAKWGNTKLRVALVLDNTGSMSSAGKMTALQTATKNLLNQLKAAVTNTGDVYVSVIPFSKDVNLGASNYNASWIYWGTSAQDTGLTDNTSWDANNGSCSRGSAFTNRGDCVSYPICSKTQYTSQSQCQNKNGTWYTSAGRWTPANHSTWNGCVMDRGNASAPSTNNYDTNVVAPSTSNTATLYPAEQYGNCNQAAMGLSYDWTSMTNLVNAMSPNGNTNQGLGLQLGWLSLVGGGPFTVPAMDPKYRYNQVVILLTDGLNTQNRWYTTQSKIDARETLTCNNIKAAGITLYTIQVNTDGDPTSTLLQNCASTSDKFFLLTSATQIVTTFNTIGTALSNLRISQ
jgi:Flp pilus assembly protein TadG